MSEWISVEDRLPDEDIGVLVADAETISAAEKVGIGDHYFWVPWEIATYEAELTFIPTHWMPLPDAPVSEGQTDD